MDWRAVIHKETPAVATDDCRPGDEVRVWFKIYEQEKERVAQFEGIVIRARGGGASRTLTVRRVTYGEGVERNFPLNPRVVSRVEVLRRGKVKRSRLYYLRAIIGKTRIAAAQPAGETRPGEASSPNASLEVAAAANRPDVAIAAGKAADAAKTRA
ncbi:MAG: 50S ribosomal protein L19 [Candidatus Omnitrophica bacterium]|nr:50S ribosomal protein L19 [Candidatus Omnitrophota bacterium]